MRHSIISDDGDSIIYARPPTREFLPHQYRTLGKMYRRGVGRWKVRIRELLDVSGIDVLDLRDFWKQRVRRDDWFLKHGCSTEMHSIEDVQCVVL